MKIFKYTKLTPLLIVLCLLEAFLILVGIYIVAKGHGGSGLGGMIMIIGAFLNIFLILIEQLIANIKGVNGYIFWGLELAIILFAAFYFEKNGISVG